MSFSIWETIEGDEISVFKITRDPGYPTKVEIWQTGHWRSKSSPKLNYGKQVLLEAVEDGIHKNYAMSHINLREVDVAGMEETVIKTKSHKYFFLKPSNANEDDQKFVEKQAEKASRGFEMYEWLGLDNRGLASSESRGYRYLTHCSIPLEAPPVSNDEESDPDVYTLVNRS